MGGPVSSKWANFSYSASNVSEANGMATITARNTGGGPGGTWTGGILSTNRLYQFEYGFVEVYAKLPEQAKAFWPAIWLFGDNELPRMSWI